MSVAPTVVTEKSYESNWGYSSGLTASSIPYCDLAFPFYRHIEKIIDAQNEIIVLESSSIEPIFRNPNYESRLTDDLRKILFMRDNQEPDLSITKQINILTAKLQESYELVNSFEIINHLLNHMDFIDILEKIPTFLLAYFNKSDSLALELIDDPEDLGVEFLTVIIITSEANENALENLEKFQKEWLSKIKETTKYDICFDVEYE